VKPLCGRPPHCSCCAASVGDATDTRIENAIRHGEGVREGRLRIDLTLDKMILAGSRQGKLISPARRRQCVDRVLGKHRSTQRKIPTRPDDKAVLTADIVEGGRVSKQWPLLHTRQFRVSALARGEVNDSPRARAANADLCGEHAKRRRPQTALLLAYNLFGGSFFEASCRLGGKPTGRCL
jgi:hypothetical protein